MSEAGQKSSEANAETVPVRPVNKACEACRLAKIRCQIESGHVECRRCLKSSRQCVFNAPQQRSRRVKDKNTRVAELEVQIKVLQQRLRRQQATGNDFKVTQLRFQEPLTSERWQASPSFDITEVAREQAFEPARPDTQKWPSDLVPQETADYLLLRYRSHFESQYPFVITSPSWTVSDLATHWPMTFLAILTATSVSFDLNLHRKLNAELISTISKAVMLETGRSLDLVRAMVVTAIWYSPTERLESLRHYKYAHLAATVAIDLDQEEMRHDIEYHRTLLSCYFLCTGISLAMGRPTMIHYTGNFQHSSQFLAQSSSSIETLQLVAWIQLQRMAEMAVADFFTNPLDISEFKVQEDVESACHKLDQWKQNLMLPLEGSMAVHYYQVRSRVLCICLHLDHPPEDFRPPFRIRPVGHGNHFAPALSPFYVRTSLRLVETLHGALDAILAMTPLDLLVSPVITYARACHAISVLLMIGTDMLSAGHPMSKIIDLTTLRIDHYLEQLVTAVRGAGLINDHQTPVKFCNMLLKIQIWWTAQRQGNYSATTELRPFLSTKNVFHASGTSDISECQYSTTQKSSLLGDDPVNQSMDKSGSGNADSEPTHQPSNLDASALSPDSSPYLDLMSYDLGELPDLDWTVFDSYVSGELT